MRFSFVAKHRGIWPVSWICEALGVSRSGFHAWLNRSPSRRAQYDEVLVAGIRSSFAGSDRTYGARRVWHDVLAEGLDAGLQRIERLMRQEVCGLVPAGVGCPRMRESAMRSHPTSWIGRSWHRRRPRSESPTSPTSGRHRGGSMWRQWSTSTPVGWWAGR